MPMQEKLALVLLVAVILFALGVILSLLLAPI
jgi:hypothetical protein